MTRWKHGANGYSRHKCRCEVCCEGNRKHKKAWRDKRREGAPPERFWPLEPLFAYVAAGLHKVPHVEQGCVCGRLVTISLKTPKNPGPPGERDCLTRTELTRFCHISLDRLKRWEAKGLSDVEADRMAVRAGTHPSCIWPQWDAAALTVLDDVHLFGSDRAEPGWRQAALHKEAG